MKEGEKRKHFMAYYRAWRDKTMEGVNTTLLDKNWLTMNEIPHGIDIVNVFSYIPPGEEKKAQPFFDELRTNYVPTLHLRGVKITRAVSYRKLLNIKPTEDFNAYANELLDEYVRPYNIDGLDIDMEERPSDDEIRISDAVIKALSKYIGPKANNDTMLVYDTNSEYLPVIENVADCFTYLGYQQYGSDDLRTRAALNKYAGIISKEKFMPGLTFPEEKDIVNRWHDAVEPYEASNMFKVAKFAADNNLFGMFVYALDRDGRTYEGSDYEHVKPTNFLWTKTAILELKGCTLRRAKEIATHFWNRTNTVNDSKDIVEKINKASSIYAVNKILLGASNDIAKDGLGACGDSQYDPIYEQNLMK